MSDYIDRQAAIDALIQELKYKPESYWDNGLNQYDIENVLKTLPSADVAEVVRCKNCKAVGVGGDGTTHYYVCMARGEAVSAQDYCSKGEHKDEK